MVPALLAGHRAGDALLIGRHEMDMTKTMVDRAGPMLDRLTKLARGHSQHSRAADSFGTLAADRCRHRAVARAMATELAEQVDALDVAQLRLLLTTLLGRTVASEPPMPLPLRAATPVEEVASRV